MKQKENQRITLTKKMLKNSLLHLMEEKNIQQISVSELCKNAGINRATFYRHYSTPPDIMREMGNEIADDIQMILKEKNAYGNVPLHERIRFACEYLQEHKEAARLVFRNNTPESEFAVKLICGQDDWEAIYSKITSTYGEEGKDLLLTFFVHGAYCMITKWLLEDMKKTPQEMGKLITEICMNGLTI